MSTTYTLKCESVGNIMTLTIIDSLNLLPSSDTWSCEPSNAMSLTNGSVANWGTATIYLHGSGAGALVELENFGKHTQIGDSGTGSKSDPDGIFPSGSFSWQCIARE
ncbi:hypothetical protein B9T26_10580 [Acinetobacter sp. ANC 4169]|uniref:hypothetical protein n=1 Tax=Acinetobacter sp. ANC 4169 TaxID=1977879 RepID=UPI000A3349F6|nr:hypothetical protein [Acinetobacter sp. ANC 4169]OTG72366.1 hypothetical protein B9T26_10580 [Acinetobacter sp. ANC 4169]